MKDGLNRRGFLGALGALTALVVATPLLARECAAPPEELVEPNEPDYGGMVARAGTSATTATCDEIFRKLYAKSVPAQLARRGHPVLGALRYA